MIPLDWRLIRTWNGSQHHAFEELCCQFAKTEGQPLQQGSKFFRRGTPDGGVECHWQMPNGEFWGWQAKFVTGPKLWGELDRSVRTAIERNPTLVRYTVCVPLSLPDERRPPKKSARQRWDEHVAKWKDWAAQQNRHIAFELWDESILLEFLAKPSHIGRRAFWFGGPAFTPEWFSTNGVRPAVRQASTRYTPPLHIDLPIQQIVTALRCDAPFHKRLSDEADSLLNAMDDCLGLLFRRESDTTLVTLRTTMEELAKSATSWAATTTGVLDVAGILELLTAAMGIVAQTARKIVHQEPRTEIDHRYEADRLWDFYSALEETKQFFKSSEMHAAGCGRLVVLGGAGSGKTHLFCKIAEASAQEKRPVILLLGEQFDASREPWMQIIQLMGQLSGRDEFLGALDASGEAVHCRALILLDGINEGPGIAYWRRHLGSMLEHLNAWPHIALALSIRDSYEGDLRKIVGHELPWISHTGFRERASEAARHFFRHYQLAEPNMPFLDQEYENPLFLKLLCVSLSNRLELRLSDPPSFRELLQMVLDDANERIAMVLDYDPSERFVQRAVNRIAELMRLNGTDRLPWTLVKAELDNIKPSDVFSRSLAQRLVSEDLLVRIPSTWLDGDDGDVRFAYQRFSDFIIVEDWLLQEREAGRNGAELLQRLATNAEQNSSATTWMEAAAIISPEIGGPDLPSLIPGAFESPTLRSAFLRSIVWRTPKRITEVTTGAVLKLLRKDRDSVSSTFEALLATAARPRHPLNADWLDNFLRSLAMPERDSIWSTAIFGGYTRQSNVRRLVEWAWQENAADGLSDEIVRLSSLALAWMLTTSDRFVRDRATKALVSLLDERITILRWLLTHFAGISEPYVQERLFAVAYGCALRTTDSDGLGQLAQEVYDRIFRNGAPPPSVLLRDHARGVVETANRRGLGLDFEARLIVPPYRSEPPSEPPSIEDLEKAFDYRDWHENGHHSSAAIFQSMTNQDFNWYTVKDVHQWSAELRSRSLWKSPRKLYRALLTRLPKEKAYIVELIADHYARVNGFRSKAGDNIDLSPIIESIERALPELIGKNLARLVLTRLKPYLCNPLGSKFSSHFSIPRFVRLILQRILEYGWRSELFDDFDRTVSSEGRSTRKAERVGKKYQWMAYDELHARISDNFGPADDEVPVMDDRDWELGIWPTLSRDLDPSLLIRTTSADGWGANHVNWWTPPYSAWRTKATPSDWLKSTDDIPPPSETLLIKDNKGDEWLLLDGHHFYQRKLHNTGAWSPERDRQEVSLFFHSYLVRTEHLPDILQWSKRQNWCDNCLPTDRNFFHVHLHEHYEGPIFDKSLSEDWSYDNWQQTLPHPVIPSFARYICEHNVYDCSLDGTVILALPSRWLAEKATIRINGRNGNFVAPDGKLVAFDPSSREEGRSCLLFRKSVLLNTLEREGMTIFWTLYGEKNIYPPEINRDPWHGRLTILGAYSLSDGRITGSFRTDFQPGHPGR